MPAVLAKVMVREVVTGSIIQFIVLEVSVFCEQSYKLYTKVFVKVVMSAPEIVKVRVSDYFIRF